MSTGSYPLTADGAGQESLRVLVVALTYRRPHDLAELLPALVEQVQSVSGVARVLVVDNDPDAGAREQVQSLAFDGLVEYAHAPNPGISAARNVALSRAENYDLLVFIDDDERPSPDWLRNLLDTYREHRSAAVVGPVVSTYAAEPDPWILAGRFFTRRRLPTGTRVDLAATNNLLLDMVQLRALGLAFDERFGLSGGSDTLFTRQLHARGGVMTWCDEAVVFDIVPQQRLTRRWVVQRAFRSGNTWMRTSLVLAPSPRAQLTTRLGLAAQGATRVVGGLGRFTLGVATGRVGQRARGVRTLARGAGLLTGALGSVYSEYKR